MKESVVQGKEIHRQGLVEDGNALSLELLLENHGRDTQQDEESLKNSKNKSKTRLRKKR